MGPHVYETVIGLEIHAQLQTESKLFCPCRTEFGSPPNTQVCPVCLGLPGALPVLNSRAVILALSFALAVDADISLRSVFSRKHYFYPDLPKGYQITQFHRPLAKGGKLEIGTPEMEKMIRLERINLEEDAGKSLHDGMADAKNKTYIDFNRCGIPLLEIVTHPEIRDPQEAVESLQLLKQALQYLKICSGSMEEGSLRCDANLSVRQRGDSLLGVKTEIKNINSFRHLHDALAYEAQRQISLVFDRKNVQPETRHWDEKKGKTFSLRTKEEAHDYRYLPEPDLPPLVLSKERLQAVRERLPEMPWVKRKRLVQEYGISIQEADILIESAELADYFEQTSQSAHSAQQASRWILREVLQELKESQTDISQFPLSPGQLGELIRLVEEGTVSMRAAKLEVFNEMLRSRQDPYAIIKSKGLEQISDKSKIEEIIEKIISSHPSGLRQYLDGKQQVFDFFFGRIMEHTKGAADPRLVKKLLKVTLDKQTKATSEN
jgi:aspartyl-tRNA(Asn)/glutamyl-tRNA(Gln) amidotransferase subunit B